MTEANLRENEEKVRVMAKSEADEIAAARRLRLSMDGSGVS